MASWSATNLKQRILSNSCFGVIVDGKLKYNKLEVSSDPLWQVEVLQTGTNEYWVIAG